MSFLRLLLLSMLLTTPGFSDSVVSPGPQSAATSTPKPASSAALLFPESKSERAARAKSAPSDAWQPFRLIVPSLPLDIAIGRGADLAALRKGPGHDSLSAYPGKPGNSVIAAHRNILGAHFWYLPRATAGTPITIETPREILSYRVAFARLVPETQTEVLENAVPTGAAPRLTLYTCTLPISTNRFVVVANLISRRPATSNALNRPAVLPKITSGPLHLLKDKALRARLKPQRKRRASSFRKSRRKLRYTGTNLRR